METTGLEASDLAWAPTWLQIARQIRRVHHSLERALDAAVRYERVSFAQLEIMLVLDERPRLHAGGIARELGIRRQSVHESLTKLHRDGWVDLLPRDGAVRGAILTAEGKDRAIRCIDALEPVVGELGRLTAAERRALLRVLERVEAALRPPPRRWWLD